MTVGSPWYIWPFRVLGLTGADGWPSFSKLVIVGVMLSYVPEAIPFAIGCLVVAGSYGRAMLRDFLTRGTTTIHEAITTGGTAARAAVQRVQAVSRHIDEPYPAPKCGEVAPNIDPDAAP